MELAIEENLRRGRVGEEEDHARHDDRQRPADRYSYDKRPGSFQLEQGKQEDRPQQVELLLHPKRPHVGQDEVRREIVLAMFPTKSAEIQINAPRGRSGTRSVPARAGAHGAK
jgi:hypothetical protein